MKLTHGSPKNISKEGGFEILDYEFDSYNDNNPVPSGADTYGPGIYTYVVDNGLKDAVSGATGYAGNGGYIHFLSVDVEEDQLLNNRDSDEIDEDQWLAIMNTYIDEKRKRLGHFPDELRTVLSDHAEEFLRGELDADSFNEQIDESTIKNFDLDIGDHDDHDDLDEWMDAVMSDYEMLDPCSNIDDMGGIHNIYRHAIQSSDSLWEVIHDISNKIAYYSGGGKGFNDNGSFKKAFFDVMGNEEEYKGAVVCEGRYFVAFDVDALSIDKIVQYKRPESDHEISI